MKNNPSNSKNGDFIVKIPTIKFSPPKKTTKAGQKRVASSSFLLTTSDSNSSKSVALVEDQFVKLKLDFNFTALKYILVFLAIATGVAGGIISIYAYNKFAAPDTLGVSVADINGNVTSEQVKPLIKKVSQILVLPKNEIPDVLVINDLTQLHANPFFQNASLKDYILIYKKAAIIILYNPTANKIVNMGPYSTGNTQATPSSAPTGPVLKEPQPTPEPSVQPSTSPIPGGP